jgi:hypothetical protein
MKQMNQHLAELITLYWANQERMMAYDQAGNAARDLHLREFFFEKAEESEQAADAIGKVMRAEIPTESKGSYVLPGAKLFERAIHQKPATFLITCAKQLENTIANLYTQIVTDLSAVPESVLALIKSQQEQIRQAKLQMAKL